VTPAEVLDQAIFAASQRGVVLATYGDMLRVPGTTGDLSGARARGADVRVVYSAMDAVAIAEAEPTREVVFLAIGFETTAPAHAMAVHLAHTRGVANFSLLVSHVLVPPALRAILDEPERRVNGFLAAGHVCTVMGTSEYEPIAAQHRVPIVVTGFEPLDILDGLLACVTQLEEGRAQVENRYARAVRAQGNDRAQAMIREIFEVAPKAWRGLGTLPRSGLVLREPYRRFDAVSKHALPGFEARETECMSGLVLVGKKKPGECPAFGTRCTPDRPLGATMVSSEGACAAYYRFRRSS
jgi:hydrogenase expression/formation protein HypD